MEVRIKNIIIGASFDCRTKRMRTEISVLPELRFTRLQEVFYYVDVRILFFCVRLWLIHAGGQYKHIFDG
ncbi:MAG: hypothetical protein LBG96_03175 [Tannerella sp.]|jgi:hypothetical protein|nr:hypothetical protein [Tannerella sp.]